MAAPASSPASQLPQVWYRPDGQWCTCGSWLAGDEAGPAYSPVATPCCGSLIHSLHDPAYSLPSGYPANARANRL
ncbi:hypothetical protein E5221_27540 [Pseudomonas sp. A2]|nr:hypothetical protein E5221_27540 [Pseudomonas sp. A2]